MSNPFAISPLDGRYEEDVSPCKIFSEFSLTRNRIRVEVDYIFHLEKNKIFPSLTIKEKENLLDCWVGFNKKSFQKVKALEKECSHDIKACERYITQLVSLPFHSGIVHFGLTSEDINNIAYSLIFKAFIETIQLPQLKKIIRILRALTRDYSLSVFPARTHGQLAIPTTFGKEMAVYLIRLLKKYNQLKKFKLTAKLNGAVGNHSASSFTIPDRNWIALSSSFIKKKYDLDPQELTTQVEPGDNLAEYLDLSKQINTIVNDLNKDIWLYTSYGYLSYKTSYTSVGSSTMPHKVNPINFETSEGNLDLSSCLLSFLSATIPQSRMQRDLSGSTLKRNIGVALTHSYLGINNTLKGLKKISLNKEYCLEEVMSSPLLLTEAYQTALRVNNISGSYELLSRFSKKANASSFKQKDLLKILNEIKGLSLEEKNKLLNLSVNSYLGYASMLCISAINDTNKVI